MSLTGIIRALPLLLAVSFGAPAQAENRISCLLETIKQTFPGAAVTEASGLVRSPFKKFLFQASGGRVYKDLAPYFGKKAAHQAVALTEADAPFKMRELSQALNGGGFPELKARQKGLFHQWKSATEVIAKKAGVETADISDYVIFHDHGQIAFARKEGALHPVQLRAPPQGDAGQVVVVSEQAFPVPAGGELELEFAVREFATKYVQGSSRVRRMSPATNDMRYARDTLFEWDGEVVNALRDNGGRSLPNLQELTREALRRGISVDSSGRVSAIPEVREQLRQMYEMARPGLPEGRASFQVEFDRAMDRAVFHELSYRAIGNRDAVVRKFLASPEYERFAREFVDRHIAYVGATQYELAQAILAESSLYRFERRFQGVTSPQMSYSQKTLAGVDGYHDSIQKWLEANLAGLPEDIPSLVRELGGGRPFPEKAVFDEHLKEMVAVSEGSLRNLAGQLKRHDTHNKLTGILDRAGLITDTRRSFPNNLIGNVGLGKAKVDSEDIYTLAAFLDPQRVDGYLGAGKTGYRELRPFKPAAAAVSDAEIARIGRELVSAPDFAKQRDLIEKYAEQISAYLMKSDGSPEVQKFAKNLYGDKLAYTLFPRTSVHDPNVISRFYPESYAEFEKMARYRYLFDLTHGLTTELVKKKLGRRKHIERALSGKWKKYEFDDIKDDEVMDAMKAVLASGDHRLKRLSQEHVHETKLVDAREELEVWFGWDTYDMTFLRHSKNSDVWESLGAGWSCICFIRKTIFNADVFRQF